MSIQDDLNSLAPGSMLGVYRLTEPIGKGGFSEVYSAWDTRLNRVVAIKIIHKEIENTRLTIQFKHEADIIARLEHPNILPLYDFGEEQTFRFLVTRYVTGGSLAKKIQTGRIIPSEIFRLMKPIAATLDYIHERRIVHRDLKPGNILLDGLGIPYLADFGLAKEISDDTYQFNSQAGTLTYMAPEQFNGGTVTTQSDQYSLGILLYQLFCGTLPYDGYFAFAVRQINHNENLPDITASNKNLPPQLNEYLWRLTAVDPQLRPTSAVQIMNDLLTLFHETGDLASGLMPVLTAETALESGTNRKREANLILEKRIQEWHHGEFNVSRTHILFLNVVLTDLPELIDSDVRSLMLRGALEDGHYLDYWWTRCHVEERQRAVLNALKTDQEEILLRTLRLILTTAWANQIDAPTINVIGDYLIPPSDLTPVVLQFLSQALPTRSEWIVDEQFHLVDQNLRELALSGDAFAPVAAHLIGQTRHEGALRNWPLGLGRSAPLLTVYEIAESLPASFPFKWKFQLTLILAYHQLTRNPREALGTYLWSAVGNIIALAMMIYVVYRKSTISTFVPILNAIGQGLLFGLIYGLGTWLTAHISRRLKVITPELRALTGIIVGGIIVTIGFSVYQQLVYDDVLDFSVALPAGLLYVMGFALRSKLRLGVRVVAVAAGVCAAFLLPWWIYLISDGNIRSPFIFDDTSPQSAIPLVIIAALILAIIAIGHSRLIAFFIWLGNRTSTK